MQNTLTRPNNNKVVNNYIVYELDTISNTRNTDYTIQNVLFGAIKVTKTLIIEKIHMKVTEFVLMKVVYLAWVILLMVET